MQKRESTHLSREHLLFERRLLGLRGACTAEGVAGEERVLIVKQMWNEDRRKRQ
jgi:hypothetical protein